MTKYSTVLTVFMSAILLLSTVAAVVPYANSQKQTTNALGLQQPFNFYFNDPIVQLTAGLLSKAYGACISIGIDAAAVDSNLPNFSFYHSSS